MTIEKEIGMRIRHERERQHLTQENLATLAGVNTSFIGQVERGESNFTIHTLEKIAVSLHVPFGTLLEKLPKNAGTEKATAALEVYDILSTLSPHVQEYVLETTKNLLKNFTPKDK